MSDEDYGSYADAQSNSSIGDDVTMPSEDSGEVSSFEPRPRRTTVSSSFFRSESLFLAVLFAAVALLLPTFFSFASPPATLSDEGETRSSPLATLIPYIPTITSVFHLSYSTIHLLLRPFFAILSVALAFFAPLFLAFTILFKIFVLVPSRMIAELARTLYPVYLFCGVACIFGAGIGLGGRLLIEGSKLMLASPQGSTDVKKKDRKRHA